MHFSDSYKRRLQIWQSNYGRDDGWYVELEGVRVAELVDCQFVDMFWDCYRIIPLENELNVNDELFQREFWDNFQKLIFRSRSLGDVADSAFPGATPLDQEGRLVMRGLYLHIDNPSWLDRLAMWWVGPMKQAFS